jgi:hypothetical protein
LIAISLNAKKRVINIIRFFVPFTGFNQYSTITPGFMDAVEVVAEVEDADLHSHADGACNAYGACEKAALAVAAAS